jgi:endonuclease/exonuclease/phosphatase (EEP) superfamily protein YafD
MSTSNARARWSLRGVADAALWVGLAASFGLCLLTLAAFLGKTHWLLELTTHFRPHYAGGLLACAVIYAIARRYRTAAVFAVFMAINAFVITPRFALRDTAPTGSAEIKLLLSNVLTSNRDYDALLALVAREQPDIVALLEVNDKWMAGLAPLAITHPHSLRVPRSDNFGIALFSRRPLGEAKTIYLSPAEVPSLRVALLLAGQPISLLVTHPVPPGDADNLLLRNQQLAAVARWSAASPTPAIVLGDLNCTPWSPAFRALLKDGALQDTGRGLNPTWPVQPWWLRIPLDHCLATRSFIVTNHHVGPAIGSDHFPLLVTLALPPATR